MVKEEIRAIGIDDTPFKLKYDLKTNLIGVIYRGKNHLEEILKTYIEVDGLDSTEKIIEMIKGTKFFEQLKVIFLSGITFGGFNTVNLSDLFLKTNIPIIVILERKPNYDAIKIALNKLNNSDIRWRDILEAGDVFLLPNELNKGKIYFQHKGIDYDQARDFIRTFQTKSNNPEPIRVSHIIAKIFKNNY